MSNHMQVMIAYTHVLSEALVMEVIANIPQGGSMRIARKYQYVRAGLCD